MKKGALSFLMVFLIAPIVFADITITTNQNIYNIGNKIKASASVMQNENFEGLFKLNIACEDYKLQYFLTPVSLEANFRTAISIPELAATSSMLGNCNVIGSLLTNDNLAIEEKKSESFSITSKLSVLPVKSKITALPGSAIQLTGIINEAFGNNVLKASTEIALGNISSTVEAADGSFNATLEMPKNIKSGKHIIEISASDAKGNSGASAIELEITAVPIYIKTELSSNKLEPGSKIEIISSVYDQADDIINTSLDIELISPKGDKVFRKIIQSNEKIEYEFSQYAEPGFYVLISAYKNLQAQASINITTVREVKVKYENETVIVENIGNVPFEDELTFILKGDLKKYPLTKKVEVEPGKILSIDLSKEVPFGIYDVVVPIKEGFEPVKESINEKVQDALESAQQSMSNLLPEKVLADNVTIHDNRPAYKKAASSLTSISGFLTGAEGLLTKNPLIAPGILVIIVLLIIFRYGRKPIIRLIRGKKNGEN